MSSLATLSDPGKRDLFAQDVVYEVKEMESPATVNSGECSKAALLESANAAAALPFDYEKLIVPDSN